MAGHGVYVWSAYGISTLVLVLMVSIPLRRTRALKREIRGQLRREQGHARRQQPTGE